MFVKLFGKLIGLDIFILTTRVYVTGHLFWYCPFNNNNNGHSIISF